MDERAHPRTDRAQAPPRPAQLVLVLVAALDRRIIPAVRFLSTLTGIELRAVHVATDPDETRRLAYDWMALDLPWLPLHIHDLTASTLAASIGNAITDEATGFERVTVVVPEMTFEPRWHELLHRRTARQIVRAIHHLPGVTALVAPLSGDTTAVRKGPPTR